MIHRWSAFGGPTMVDTRSKWEDELGRWLEPFLDRLGHKARRRMCPLYVSGLIGPGDRKSVQPMAARLAPGDYDQLHHFIADGVWDAAPLESELLVQGDRLVGGKDAVLVIDDTAMPKKGDRSVGVAPQYASSLGKTANCQTLVSLTLARGEVPVMVALRLFLPENWTSDPARLARAGVPAEHQAARTKPEIALAEIDRMMAAGLRFGCVLADAGYGLSASFRQHTAEAYTGRHHAIDLGQCDLRLRSCSLMFGRNTRSCQTRRIARPVLGKEQAQRHHHRHFASRKRQRHQRLAVGGLAQGRSVLRSHTN